MVENGREGAAYGDRGRLRPFFTTDGGAQVIGAYGERGHVWELISAQPAEPGDGGGTVGRLRRLCRAMAAALSAAGVGMSVRAGNGVPNLTTAADSASERLEELQSLLGEGPWADALATGQPVLVPDLADGGARRWPAYAPMLGDAGIQSAFAFPMQVGAARLGVLSLFRSSAGELSGAEVAQALTFADAAVTTLLDDQEVADGAGVGGLEQAIEYRAQVFQAQGMVMIQLGVDLTEALTRMRAYAYAENRRLSEVAEDIVARILRLEPDWPRPE